MTRIAWTLLLLALVSPALPADDAAAVRHVWETHEITLEAEGDYANPSVEVICWVQLRGPGFDRRVYGFWDGGRTFRRGGLGPLPRHRSCRPLNSARHVGARATESRRT